MLNKEHNIFITGSTGFLGGYIVRRLLKDGYKNIHCSHRETSNFVLVEEVKSQVNWHLGELSDPVFVHERLQQMDVVIHAAALVNSHAKEKAKIDDTNIALTRHLVDQALDNNVKRFVHVSSVAALGMGEPGKMLHEQTEWKEDKRNTVYSISKHYGEREVFRGFAEGMDVVVLNPSMILGAGRWKSSTVSIFNLVKNGLPYYPAGSVGIVDVRDVANSVALALTNDQMIGRRFVISGENWTHQRMSTELAKALNAKIPNKQMSPFLSSFVKKSLTLVERFGFRHDLISAERIDYSNYAFNYDNSASIEVGMSYIPIMDTINESAQLYLQSQKDNSTFGLLNI